MSFKDVQNIQLSYNSLSDEIVVDFYIPCLEQAVVYKRAVGFFSSNILLQISKGLGAFADHGGKMKLLVSPKLEPEDYEAIKKGYDVRHYVTEKMIKDFDFNIEFNQRDSRFEMLAHMIASGMLEIKVVVLEENNDIAMFHRKVGIMEDASGNQIVFSGSGNETYNGYNLNDEDFEVFCSWKSDESEQRCSIKDLKFELVWNGISKGLITIPFPEVIKNKLLTYKKEISSSFTEIDTKFKEYLLAKKNKPKTPEIAEGISLHDYQKEAIEKWAELNYRGIFDMATGTGKTFTGAGAICRLFKDKKRLVVFVCCPFTHLVDQWCEELANFNIEPIKCYGSVDYETKLNRAITKFKQKRSDFVCAVITNASFQKESIQNLIQANLSSTLLIVDEAHNFGADGVSKTLKVDYPYRLALSATLDRYGDEEGTAKLYEFFGEKCIEYGLERAIKEGKLTPYKYYPVLVSLNDDEYDEYIKLSKQIAKFHSPDGSLSESAKRLLIKRARLVAGAANKLICLREKIIPYQSDHNMLVYCGAIKYGQVGYSSNEDEERQIEAVLNLLNNDLHIYSTKFTSDENTEMRREIITSFKQQNIQALVAIKCLDEGMNIPAIKTAFILASSTNPKEYIQRRGRVLRKAPGKEYAEIYDFITLPRSLSNTSTYGNPNLGVEKNLVRKELNRLVDFANLSKNPSDSNDIILKIKDSYDMDIIMDEEDLYE